MTEPNFTFKDNTITIWAKAPIWVVAMLFVLGLVGVITPFFVVAAFMHFQAEFNMVSWAFFGIIFVLFGGYLIKLGLWNKYGKEIVQLTEEGVVYHADFGFFLLSKKTLKTARISYQLVPDGDTHFNLVFIEANESLKCVIKIPNEYREDFQYYLGK